MLALAVVTNSDPSAIVYAGEQKSIPPVFRLYKKTYNIIYKLICYIIYNIIYFILCKITY